jgi:hypothetical protein
MSVNQQKKPKTKLKKKIRQQLVVYIIVVIE